MKTALFTFAALLALAPAAYAQDQPVVKSTFHNTQGQENGNATLTGTPTGVLVDLEVTGLPPGQWVAFHIHASGHCDHATAYDSAGGHFNPTEAAHGYKAPKGPHAGDMPNQFVGADGAIHAQVFNSAVRLDKGKTGIHGKALIIHAGKDDYVTQPTGDAGKRLACAVIE